MYVCIYIYIYIYTYIHTYIHTYMYIYIYIYIFKHYVIYLEIIQDTKRLIRVTVIQQINQFDIYHPGGGRVSSRGRPRATAPA